MFDDHIVMLEDFMQENKIPFGLVFKYTEEKDADTQLVPIYDPLEGISYLENDIGERKPFIELSISMMATPSWYALQYA